jgi:putative PIN family toxin of toxin-antitoxin system
MTPHPISRVVFDTNVVIAALLFPRGRLAWLRAHWKDGCVPLVSHETLIELARVLAYSKFRLSDNSRTELLGLYLPNCEAIQNITARCPILCRDAKDQCFLDLAHSGRADTLVTGDDDLLALAGQTAFRIETPEAYRGRKFGDSQKSRYY